jgi:hypothetical protein
MKLSHLCLVCDLKYGFFINKALYLPWVMLFWSIAMGGGFEVPLMGIAAGHVGYYFDVLYPSSHRDQRLFNTPEFLKAWFPRNVGVYSSEGAAQQETNKPRTGSFYGRGQKLGS